MNYKILVITNCSKKKLQSPTVAQNLYQGLFFRNVKTFSKRMQFDLCIISAKYGLLNSDEIIEPYDKTIKSKKDILELKENVSGKFDKLLNEYDKIIFIMAKNYLEIFKSYLDNSKIICAIDHRGSGGFLQLTSKLKKIKKLDFLKLIKTNRSFTIEDIELLEVKSCLT